MGSDNLHLRRSAERRKRRENVEKQKSSNWLVVCEGKKTEPNYFAKAIDEINKNIDEQYKLKVKIIGTGMNTKSLVKATEMQVEIDKYSCNVVPYGKIFVVFDKDSFAPEDFDQAITMCENNGYIPLWSNQAVEFWFLLHFNYICSKMDRAEYSKKLNEYFKNKESNYKYKKNDVEIYNLLCKYGSLDNARKYAKKISDEHQTDKPSLSESCTQVYKFFDVIDERLNELK
jgi:hypothetical protein